MYTWIKINVKPDFLLWKQDCRKRAAAMYLCVCMCVVCLSAWLTDRLTDYLSVLGNSVAISWNLHPQDLLMTFRGHQISPYLHDNVLKKICNYVIFVFICHSKMYSHFNTSEFINNLKRVQPDLQKKFIRNARPLSLKKCSRATSPLSYRNNWLVSYKIPG